MPRQTAEESLTPGSRRKRRSSAEVGDRILEAAAEEFEQSGYSGATTAAIARRAEVTEAQIFRFHASKQELFRAAIFQPLNRHFADFHKRHSLDIDKIGTDRDLVRQYILELQQFMQQHSGMFMSLIVASAYSPGSTDGVGEMEGLRDYFDRGAATMRKRLGPGAKVAPELMVRVSFAAVLANLMFHDWLFPAGLASEVDISEALVDFVIDGLGANDI